MGERCNMLEEDSTGLSRTQIGLVVLGAAVALLLLLTCLLLACTRRSGCCGNPVIRRIIKPVVCDTPAVHEASTRHDFQ